MSRKSNCLTIPTLQIKSETSFLRGEAVELKGEICFAIERFS